MCTALRDSLCSSAEGLYLRAKINYETLSLPSTFTPFLYGSQCMMIGVTAFQFPGIIAPSQPNSMFMPAMISELS